jgi:hypothetical protein
MSSDHRRPRLRLIDEIDVRCFTTVLVMNPTSKPTPHQDGPYYFVDGVQNAAGHRWMW